MALIAFHASKGSPPLHLIFTIEQKEMTLGGVTAKVMTVNGSIHGPVLEFNVGDLAIINLTNKMDVETLVHWHGLILPNFFDGEDEWLIRASYIKQK